MGDPCGASFVLHAPPYSAEITEIGAHLRTLTHHGVDLVDGWPHGEPCPRFRGAVLMPWPNRVVGASWAQDGRVHHLPVKAPERHSALHGLVSQLAWRPVDQTSASIRLQCVLSPGPGYPYRLELEARYRLDDAGLRVELGATNTGREAAPYGVGPHPYLTVGLQVDEAVLRIPAGAVCAIDEDGRPAEPAPVDGTAYDFREPQAVGTTVLDHAFTDLVRQGPTAEATLLDPSSGRAVRLTVGEGFDWLQVFTADDQGERARQSVAIEPMSCPPDAFNSGTGLVRLGPGERHDAWFAIGVPPA